MGWSVGPPPPVCSLFIHNGDGTLERSGGGGGGGVNKRKWRISSLTFTRLGDASIPATSERRGTEG